MKGHPIDDARTLSEGPAVRPPASATSGRPSGRLHGILEACQVAIAQGEARYPDASPFGPTSEWPELPAAAVVRGGAGNPVYDTLRRAFMLLGLDEAHAGTPAWNPLRDVVSPGDTVVVKPNFVRDFRESSPDDADCVITHGSVIRAVIDYVWIALAGRGRIVIADAPQNDADFAAIRRIAGLDAICRTYDELFAFPIEVYDLRQERAIKRDGVITGHVALAGDPAGYVAVDLGAESCLAELGPLCERLYGAEYDRRELLSHHQGDRHEYLISGTVLQADCVISLPKLKTHKKTGITANLKNLVGINGNKNWLPHHREGTPAQGGDQYAEDGALRRTERQVLAAFKRVFPLLGPARGAIAGPIKAAGRQIFGDTNTDTIRSGNWHGNDTTWRMVLDLNRILAYADRNGVLQDRPVRKFFSVVDAIVAGEGNGPLDASPRPAGLLFAGHNPVAVDLACARVAGFDPLRLPMLERAFAPHRRPLAAFGADDVSASSNSAEFEGAVLSFAGPLLGFRPHFGWKGHVEVGGAGPWT